MDDFPEIDKYANDPPDPWWVNAGLIAFVLANLMIIGWPVYAFFAR